MVNFTSPAALPPGKRPGTLCVGGWEGLEASLDGCRKFAPTGMKSLDRPAYSEPLYVLSCLLRWMLQRCRQNGLLSCSKSRQSVGFLYRRPTNPSIKMVVFIIAEHRPIFGRILEYLQEVKTSKKDLVNRLVWTPVMFIKCRNSMGPRSPSYTTVPQVLVCCAVGLHALDVLWFVCH